MSKLFNWAAARIVAAFAFVLPLAVVAEVQMTNPVTGETETYESIFGDTSGAWNSADNWILNGTDKVPFIDSVDGNYAPAVVTGKTASTSISIPIDGWTLRVGAYDGATIHWTGGISKIQSDDTTGCWLTADETSAIMIKSFAGNQLEGSDSAPLKLSSATEGGIYWETGLTNASNTTLPFWYYLKGSGTVTYVGDITVANAQVIKQADITLSGTSQVASKRLVTFGSGTTKAFTADAAIKVKNGDVVLKTVYVNSVRSSEGTRANTTSDLSAENDAVGSCEIVQCADGIVLFWVDGNAESVTGYKRSININFTNGNGLTTTEDVGLSGYAVPGTTWNNFAVANNTTYSTVNAVDATGAATVASGVSVTVSGTRGSHQCSSLAPASNPLHGYIDESAGYMTPTVTITGIPYEHYRVIVYHSTDQNSVPFGHDTINGFDFTYDNGEQTTGTDPWGNSGESNSANPIKEGVNTLVSAVLSGDTVTMVAHRVGSSTPTARGCFAAIQVVEYVPEVGENDLEIAVNGATDYPVDAAKNLSGTVYLTGSGTLTLSGDYKIEAATIDVGKDVILNINADRLDATTFTGSGTVVYDGVVPPAGKGWSAIEWSGTVWLKNKSDITGNNNANTGVQPNSLGNVNSKVKFSGVSGWLEAPVTYNPEIVLENAGYDYALQLTNGNSPASDNVDRCTIIKKLSGSGTLGCGGSTYAWPLVQVWDATDFTGSIDTSNASGNGAGKTGLVVVFCAENTVFSDTLYTLFKRVTSGYPHPHTIYVAGGTTVTQASTATWTADDAFGIDGTLNANGTLVSSHATMAVSGSGTVVFNGKAPSPTGVAWWQNADWTGTVEVRNYNFQSNIQLGTYGNVGSKVCMDGSEAYIAVLNSPNHNIGELVIGPGGFTQDGSYSSGTVNITVPCKITGTGTYSFAAVGGAQKNVFLQGDTSEFDGIFSVGGDNCRIVLGATSRSFVAASVVVGNGKTLNVTKNTSALTPFAGGLFIDEGGLVKVSGDGVISSAGGINVDGELRAPSLDKFGDSTTITTSDDGVFTFVDSNNTHDHSVDYARITGTGTLRYADVSGKWRSLSTVNFPTGMICENNLTSGLILTTRGENTIGSLAGSGAMRSDWGGAQNVGDRTLRILQAKDTTYSGVFHSDDRITTVTVAPGASTAGTLTLSGAQTVSNDLAIESGAKVNLTGTWVGATTVAGTIGGTGTLTGDLTFSSGSTFKAYATDDADGLVVSGTVTCPGEGKVTVDVSAIASKTGVALLTADGLDADNFTLTGASDGASLEVVEDVLTLVLPPVTITVPEIANTTVTVAIDGTTIGTAAGNYDVDAGSVVTVTYVAADGYEISGLAEYTIDTSKSETTFDPSETTHVAQCVAYVVFQQESEQSLVTNYYTTVSNAIDAASAQKKTVVLVAQPDVADTYAISVGEVIRVNKNGYEFAGIVFPQGAEYNNQESVIGSITMYSCALYTAIITKPDSTQEASSVAIATLLQAIYANYANYGAETTIRVLDGTEEIQNDNYDYNSETHTYTLKTMVAYYDNGYTKTYYPTLSNAVATVNSGLTITLAENVTLTESVEVAAGKSITIDLNGKTITGPADGYAFSNAGAVTIENGTITGAGGVAENTAGGASIAVSSGSYTTTSDLFGNVEGGTIAVSGGTFSQSVADEYLANGYEVKDNGDGTYGVRESFGWIYEAADHPNYTGSWSNDVNYVDGKIKIEDGNTYTANRPSDGQLVTVEMTLSFDDANDEDGDVGDAKAAVRLASGETDGTYQFQLYTSDGANKVWTNATVDTITAQKERDYTFVFVLDLTNKVYTATVVDGAVTNAMTVGGSADIRFAYQGDVSPVQKIEFIGAGSVTSIEGSYENAPAPAEEFLPGQPIGEGDVVPSAEQAAWLNGQNNYAALAAKIATMSQDAFNKAYLLNLNVLDENYDGTYEFKVTNIAFGKDDLDNETVVVTVNLTRKGALAGGINGTLELKGGNTLPASTFDVIQSVEFTDDDFSEGNTTTCTFSKGANPAAFYQPVIR